MKIFVDSADLDEIEKAYEWGVADGVTTNPSLLKKAVDKKVSAGKKLDLKGYITRLLKTAEGTPVSLEVTDTSAEGMLKQARKLYKLFNPVAGNVNIKVPVNPAFKEEDGTHFDGIKVVKKLAGEDIPVNCTLVFTPEQALLAAKAGAAYVSPFAGRIDDLIRKTAGLKFGKEEYFPMDGLEEDGVLLEDNGIVSGIDLVAQCLEILEYYELDTEVIAASLRNTRQVREAALVGADIATIPFGVIGDMLKHVKTYEGMKAFTADIVDSYVDLTR
ncbi:MAG: transaldolase family protein [Candidatus Altiarchaeota archaeon]